MCRASMVCGHTGGRVGDDPGGKREGGEVEKEDD